MNSASVYKKLLWEDLKIKTVSAKSEGWTQLGLCQIMWVLNVTLLHVKCVTMSSSTRKTSLKHKCGLITRGQCVLTSAAMMLPGKEGKPTSKTKDRVAAACVDFCAENLHPSDTITCKGFLDFLDVFMEEQQDNHNISFRELVPHTTTVGSNAAQVAGREVLTTQLKAAFGSSGYISFTTDMWTDEYKQCSYSAVTGHWIEDWQLLSRVLATQEFPSSLRKTGINNYERSISPRS